jgi:BirA family biotin operon repressor/biotin-[acetyl-CoA-carboxylase] ligase
LLPLAVPLAVCEAAEELQPGIECAIKWPNDVWVDGRKLAGVLIEAKPQDGWAVIGVGLNLSIAPNEFPPDLRETAISLFDSIEGSPLATAKVLGHHLDRWVAAERGDVLPAWRSRDALRGREISWNDGKGVADGITDKGDLLVAVGDDRVVLGAGEVHLRL